MQVILLERIAKLGQMGDEVTVKTGYARNFLLPQGKALRANAANREQFESQRADLEKRNDERKADAESIKGNLDGNTYVLIRSAGQTGQLYGSVSTRDVAAALEENISVNVARSEDEAERQASGEDLTGRDEQFEHEAVDYEGDDVDLTEVFENEDDAEAIAEEAGEEENNA